MTGEEVAVQVVAVQVVTVMIVVVVRNVYVQHDLCNITAPNTMHVHYTSNSDVLILLSTSLYGC